MVARCGREAHIGDRFVDVANSKERSRSRKVTGCFSPPSKKLNARDGYRADVTVAEDGKKLFAELARDFGKLDIVFANAGISGRTPTGTTDEAIFEKVVHTNLNGAFFTVNSAAPLMNDNGSIIFNGSVHTYLGQPGVAASLPQKADPSRWRDPSPQTLHRARFA
jgi:NAD(P)-dependent dehydrogenase (short-subunit alcohol dehydrogenase family)